MLVFGKASLCLSRIVRRCEILGLADSLRGIGERFSEAG